MADPLQSNQTSIPSSTRRFYPFPNYSRLPQQPIPCEEYLTLWCLILGDKQPFKAALPLHVDVDVDDLREVIHIKGVDTTKSTVLAKDLILWKVWMLLA